MATMPPVYAPAAPPGFRGAFTFGPGGVAQSTASGPTIGGAGGGGLDMGLLQRLLLRREAERGEDRASAQAMRKEQMMAMRRQMSAAESAGQAGKAEALKAGMGLRGGRPVFTQTVGGAGMAPGRIRASQWQPGSDFAGYEEDLGTGPAAAHFIPPNFAGLSRASSEFGAPNQGPAGSYASPAYSAAGPLSNAAGGAPLVARAERSNMDINAREQQRQEQQRALLAMLGAGPRYY